MNYQGICVLSILALATCSSGGGNGTEPADLVLRGGKIVTVDASMPEAQALGSDEEIEAYIGENTRVIDLDGQLAIPGFIEGHGHWMSYGASLTELDLRHAKDWDHIVGMVEEAVSEVEPGEWIVGRGWHQDKWEKRPTPNIEGLPTHDSLSAVSPENPVFLSHTSGHSVFVNAKAMEATGITRDSLDPSGGEIVRDADGNAIGMLREGSADLARQALADYQAQRTPEEIDRASRHHIALAAEDALKNGITSFHDMGSSFETLDLLKTMADEGNLPLRLYMAIQETAEDMEDKLDDYRLLGYGNGYLTIRTIGEKVLDGALGTHGGWLLEPYNDLPRSSGFEVTPVTEIEASAALAIEHDYQMTIQGIGDRAARELFNIYEREFENHPEKADLRCASSTPK